MSAEIMETEQFWRLLRPQTMGEAEQGLRCLMQGPEPHAQDAANDAHHREQLHQFYAYCQSMGIDRRRQVMAMRDGHAVGMCLWIPSPGRSALLFCPNLRDFPAAAGPVRDCMRLAIQDAVAAGVVLVQAMIDPRDAVALETISGAGMNPLATLTYMERRPPLFAPSPRAPADVTLETYRPENHAAFRDAIMESYVNTLDCPRLTGVRSIEDVLIGHKAVGPFEPELWSLVIWRKRAVGALLLASITSRNCLELVYLGLAPAARGHGIGKFLMQQMLALSVRRNCALASVAVDAANTPAVHLYRRAGFLPVADRLALIYTAPTAAPTMGGGHLARRAAPAP